MSVIARGLLTAAFVASLAGCGGSGKSTHAPSITAAVSRPMDPVKRPTARAKLVRVGRTAYGMALTDRRGFALYRFTHDTGAPSTCYGACAARWPPYLVPPGLARELAAHTGLVGTVRRRNGQLQVSYAGHPLYYYVGDRSLNEVLCQAVTEYGGVWNVVAPDGHAIH
jgi:predicted lipoprotein with Yx(FWY)xxD motif